MITNSEAANGLHAEDVGLLQEEVSKVSRMSITWWKSQFYLQRICGRDREAQLLARTDELLAKQVDIRSFMQLHTSYSTLLNLLLTK